MRYLVRHVLVALKDALDVGVTPRPEGSVLTRVPTPDAAPEDIRQFVWQHGDDGEVVLPRVLESIWDTLFRRNGSDRQALAGGAPFANPYHDLDYTEFMTYVTAAHN